MTHRHRSVSMAVAIAVAGGMIACSKDAVSPQASTKLSGVVLHGSGEPVAGAFVSLTDDWTLGGFDVSRVEAADAEGRFVFEDTEPGDYIVAAIPPNLSPGVAARRVRFPSVSSRLMVLTLALSGGATGTATLSDATDHDEIIVSGHGLPGVTLTESSGAYRLGSIPVGTWTIVAQRLGYQTASVLVTVPSPGATAQAPDMVLEPEP